MVFANHHDGFDAVTGRTHHVHVGCGVDHDDKAATHECLVVGDDDTDRHESRVRVVAKLRWLSSVRRLALTRYPFAHGPASNSPPKSAARSRMPISPCPCPGGSGRALVVTAPWSMISMPTSSGR